MRGWRAVSAVVLQAKARRKGVFVHRHRQGEVYTQAGIYQTWQKTLEHVVNILNNYGAVSATGNAILISPLHEI